MEREPGLLNVALEDALAYAPTERAREMILNAWITLGVEYMAGQIGRRATVELLMAKREFVETAQPMRPWPE